MLKIELPKNKIKEVEIKREVRVYKDKKLKEVVKTLNEVVEMAEGARQEKILRGPRGPYRSTEDINIELGRRALPLEMTSEYKGKLNDANFRCLVPGCGHRWTEKAASVIHRGMGCEICNNRIRKIKRSKEQINEELKKGGRNIVMIGDFLGMTVKTEFLCLVKGCGHKWSPTPSRICNGRRSGCPICGGQKRVDNETIDMFLRDKPIKRIGNVINNKKPVKFRCLNKNCEYEWKTKTTHILYDGTGCPKCAGIIKHDNRYIDNFLKDKTIKRLDDYINKGTSIRFQCLAPGCDHVWKTAPSNILNGHGCRVCAGLEVYTNKKVDDLLKDRKIKRLDNIINCHKSVWWKCLNKDCGHEWKTAPSHVVAARHTGCPLCSLGKSEKHCGELIKNNVEYNLLDQQTVFKFNNREYEVDFYLEVGNNKIIIEYQGEQHYRPVRWNYQISQKRAEKNFVAQKKRDKQLRRWCKKNGIYLLEVHFKWDDKRVIEELKKINKLFILPKER